MDKNFDITPETSKVFGKKFDGNQEVKYMKVSKDLKNQIYY
jgi:hypothetical protein